MFCTLYLSGAAHRLGLTEQRLLVKVRSPGASTSLRYITQTTDISSMVFACYMEAVKNYGDAPSLSYHAGFHHNRAPRIDMLRSINARGGWDINNIAASTATSPAIFGRSATYERHGASFCSFCAISL